MFLEFEVEVLHHCSVLIVSRHRDDSDISYLLITIILDIYLRLCFTVF